jgi:hypothetical protein
MTIAILPKTTILSLALGTLCQALPALALATTPGNMPLTGKVTKLTLGDLMCYVDLIDSQGKKHTIGAGFGICDRTELLNKRVRLTYKRVRVNDCQSSEPCGKTRLTNAIVKMTLVSTK